jgi:outer membrane protein assembly factor BamD (BamD/ComL family)
MRSNWQLLSSILIGFAFIAAMGWVFWTSLKRSEDPARLIFKWVLTAGCLLILLLVVGPIVAGGGYGGAFIGIPAAAVVGLALAIIWRHNITTMIAKPFASLYDGGNEAPEPKPVYSIALAKRKRGDFLGARNAVREQLKQFPTDQEGQMLLAEIEAQDLNDLRAASILVERFISQPGHSAANIVYALNSMADWHLKYAQDREAAQACFQRIMDLLPGTEWDLRAQQRIAHLGSPEVLLGTEARRTIHVPHIEGDPGLDGGRSIAKPVEEEGGALAAKYVKHLEEFPHDTEIREQLARLYGEHFQRLDLAADQLEQLIQYPNQPQRQVVKWLNLLADFQVSFGGSYDAARAALQRIVDLYPQSGAANLAQNRMELLTREFKGKEKSQAVKLGPYEDDIGLKRGLPHQF